MRLRSLQRDFVWPPDVPPSQLRCWLRQQLAAEGELLRWAITAVIVQPDGERRLQFEAVLLSP